MAVGHLGDRPAGRQGPPPPAVGRDSHGRRRDREGRRPSLRPARARRRGRQGRRHGGVPPAQAGGLQLPARSRPDGPAPGFVAGDLVPGGRPRVGAVRSPGVAAGGGVPDLEGLSVTPTWPQLISDVIARTDLSADQTEWAMDQVMSGNTSPATLAGFLTALATKGETVAELKGLADAMLAHAEVIEVPTNTLDIVGTGGDRARTVNISSMAALVLAGAGVIESLGVSLTMPVRDVERALDAVGITFLFANLFHPSMRFAAPTRRELGVATAFNVLGPLTNPARPRANAIGVSSARHAPIVAGVLADRGNRALVFRGSNGLDELTSTAVNEVWVVEEGRVTREDVDATELGIAPATIEDLRGADPEYNANVARSMLAGAEGIITDTVLLNAAAGIVAYGTEGTREGTLLERLAAAMGIARDSLVSGRAEDTLNRWIEFSRGVVREKEGRTH